MYCTNCGTEIPGSAKFCTECGFAVQPRPAAQETVQEAAPIETSIAVAEPVVEASATVEQPTATQQAAPTWQPQPAAPAAEPAAAAKPQRRYRGRLVLAVLACLFLFWPTGIPAIVFAAKAIRLSDAGDAEPAAQAAKKSTKFVLLSLVCDIVWNILGLVLLVGKYA